MAQFVFDQIPTGPVLQVEGTDTILFHGGPARLAAVTFGLSPNGVFETTISFRGHSANFDPGVFVTAANLNLVFDDGSHLLIGGPRSEAFDGGLFSDAMFGGDGNDTLNGLAGANVIQGNQGNDVLTGGDGDDTIYGGQGDDLIVTDTNSLIFDVEGDFAQGNKGNDTIEGAQGDDTLLGGQGDDSISGGTGLDVLNGNLGNDFIVSSGGSEPSPDDLVRVTQLFGEDGNDTLVAQTRDLSLSGGAGADLFSFQFSQHDDVTMFGATITDWETQDHISVAGVRASPNYQEMTAGLYPDAVAAANAALRAGADIVVTQVRGELFAFFQTGGGPDADVSIHIVGRSLADIGPGNFI